MKTKKATLLVCDDLDRTARIAHDLSPWVEGPMVGVRTVDDAVGLGGLDGFALVLLYLDGGDDVGELDALLWNRSRARARVPVIALSAEYDEGLALTCFRMGVTEYLGLNPHRDSIPSVIRSILSPQHTAPAKVEAQNLVTERETRRVPVISQAL